MAPKKFAFEMRARLARFLADNTVTKASKGKNKRSLELNALFNSNRAAELISSLLFVRGSLFQRRLACSSGEVGGTRHSYFTKVFAIILIKAICRQLTVPRNIENGNK